MLVRLVYVSTLADGVAPSVMGEIVNRSASANARRGITGMLAIEDRRICQILEGPAAEVDALFDTIGEDRRHEGIAVIDRRPIAAPHFGNWGMANRRMVDVVMLAFSI